MADRPEQTRRSADGSTESIQLAAQSLRNALRDVDAAQFPLVAAYTELAIFLCDEELRRRT